MAAAKKWLKKKNTAKWGFLNKNQKPARKWVFSKKWVFFQINFCSNKTLKKKSAPKKNRFETT